MRHRSVLPSKWSTGRVRRLGRECLDRLGTLLQITTPVTLKLSKRRQGAHDSDVVSEIRTHDYAEYSDRDLRDALARVKTSARPSSSDEVLPRVFALVDEAISRRLGARRLLDADFQVGGLQAYRELARRVVETGPYRSRIGYYTNDDFLDGQKFRQSLDPLLAEMDLDGDERTIVATMVYVTEKSKTTYSSEILLPSEFYRALSAKDTQNVLRLQATDEQLLAGYLLYRGHVVEMNAGEGKTIAAAFPAVLHAVLGRPVHVVTVNDYLAARDADWLAPVYESLGLSVRAVLSYMSDPERKDAYEGQIVYGTMREFGFDFLRDNMRCSQDELIQGPLDVAIVDEADQALIDEARTPLIIAGASTASRRSVHRVRRAVEVLIARQREVVSELESRVSQPGLDLQEERALLAKLYLADPKSSLLVKQLAADSRLCRRVQTLAADDTNDDPHGTASHRLYYTVDARRRMVALTDRGQEFLERHLGATFDTTSLERQLERVDTDGDAPLLERRQSGDVLRRHLSRRHSLMNQVHQMLNAYILLERDVDYIVAGAEIVLIDQVTGRCRPDSQYQHGLQAALEAKEGLAVRSESEVLAQISVQGFMKQYSRISGMTGTALAAQGEFSRAYDLDAVAVPPSQPSRRTDSPTRLYATREDKLLAVLEEIRLCRQVGRPVLVGTLTVEQSEEISGLLDVHGVQHRVLNAVTTSQEAQVVRSAGSFGAVTVATNMAGRGTDIILETGLDRRIILRYITLAGKLLAEGAGQVVLSCAMPEEADALVASLRDFDELSVAREERDGTTQVAIASRTHEAKDEKSVHLEFGLGLHVIGTELNDSRRIDSQLRGRVGRQGDFGSTRFMVSLEDRTLVFQPDAKYAESADARRDRSGRALLTDASTDRRIERTQANAEMEDEVSRTAAWDYNQVIEGQTLSFYRARKKVIQSRSFHETCIEFLRKKAARLVDKYLPPSMIGRYDSQFEKMAEELWLDYRVDCHGLWGLGIDALKDGVARLMIAGIEETKAKSDGHDFATIEKLLFLHTADELWADHLSSLQEMLLSTLLCAYGHKSAVAEYLFRGVEAYQQFREAVLDAFLPRLVTFAPYSSSERRPAEVNVAQDVHEILA